MRHEPPRDREYYPSPKKQRMDYNQAYQEPERRPLPKHLQRAPEPKPAPPVIEKRPVMFNDTSKNILDYPPLPQRKPVQRPKVVPQPLPTKVIEKPPTKPVEKQVKPVQTQPAKILEKQPVKAVDKPIMKPVQNQPVKAIQNQPVKPVQNQPAKPVQNHPVKAVQNQPVKPVQNHPVKAVQNQPVKPVQNQPNKPVPAKEPVKPTQTTPVQKQTQPPQPNQEVKPQNKFSSIKKEEPTLGPCPEGYSQLSEMMSRALSEELQDVMDVIVKELPNNLPTAEERYVIKKFRTDVGEDIKKALGLNVTKRLLNIHNPLYVKLEFSGKPEPGCLQSFIKQYNISAFKRIAAPGDVFAARLDTIADLDCLCAGGSLSCGSANVTFTPCYKYLVCPPKLHTIYGKYEPEEDKKPAKSAVKTEEADKSTEGDKNKETPTKGDNVTIKQEVSDNDASDVSIKQEASDTNDDTDTETKSTKTKSPIKINITIEAVPKTNDVKASNDNKVTKEIDKPIKEEKDAKVEKDIKVEKAIKVEEAEDDLKEMNDSDILSLMSGGIVLDECSGSDDE